MINRAIGLACIFLVASTASHAQWLSKEVEDPFGTNHIIGALTMKSGKGLIVRCVGGTRLEMMYMPNEQGDDDVAMTANVVGFKVLLRIDNDPVIDLKAVAQSSDGKIIAISEIEPEIANRMAEAKKRIAAVAEFAGNRLDSVSFGVSGSRKHIDRVVAACAGSAKTN